MSNLSEAGAAQDTFTTGDAIPWKPADPRMPNGVQLYVVWGNPNEGPRGYCSSFLRAPTWVGTGTLRRINPS
jgi:hypothetical protein